MTDEQLAAKQAARDAKRPCRECKSPPGTHADACEKGKTAAAALEAAKAAEPVDLDDAAVQEAILNPEPAELTIGGNVVHLYPLAARPSRKFIALFVRVMNASSGVVAPMSIRIGTTLENDDALSADVCRMIARAEYEPGTAVDDAALDTRAQEIGDTATFDEYRDALDRMCELNRLAEIIERPKTKAAPATTS